MRRRYEMDNFLDPTPQIGDSTTFGGRGTDPKTVLSTRLQGLIAQRGQIQRRSALNNTSPLGATSERDGQDMVDLSQSIAALGQKVANPNRGIQFAAEPRFSTMQNATQAGVNMDRARAGAASRLNSATQARDLEIGNTENELAIEQGMAAPGFGDVAAGKANYTAGANRRGLARQYTGGR